MENQSIIEGLDKHLSKVNEVSNPSLSEIEKNILKRVNPAFGKLVFALVKNTILSRGHQFIQPNFNTIKPLLIIDIKDNIKTMQKEGWDESAEEIAKILLDPAEYDDEIGNYADTTFADYYPVVYDNKKGRELEFLKYYQDDLVKYLDQEIKKNYKQLIQAVK